MRKRDEARWLVDNFTAHYMIDGVSLCGRFKHKQLAWMQTANNICSMNENRRIIDAREYVFCVECKAAIG